MRRIKPDFVVELATATGVRVSILEAADPPVASVEAPIRDGRVCLDDALAEADKARQSARGRDVLLVSFGLIDYLSEAQVRELLGWIRDRDVLAAFGFTPPGEAGVAGRNSRSFRHMVQLAAKEGLSIATLSRFDVDPVQFAFAAGPNERITTTFCVHTAVVGSKQRIAKAEQTFEPPILVLNETLAEAFEQENLLRLHYSGAFDWVFAQFRELRRQLGEQIAGSEDLVRQIAQYQAAHDERQQVKAELRRQFEEQVVRSEDLVRQIFAYQTALDERQQVEAELRHQLAERVARSGKSDG
jgi:hypothetical protein